MGAFRHHTSGLLAVASTMKCLPPAPRGHYGEEVFIWSTNSIFPPGKGSKFRIIFVTDPYQINQDASPLGVTQKIYQPLPTAGRILPLILYNRPEMCAGNDCKFRSDRRPSAQEHFSSDRNKRCTMCHAMCDFSAILRRDCKLAGTRMLLHRARRWYDARLPAERNSEKLIWKD